MSEPKEKGKESGRIQSLERAFAVLEQVAAHRNGVTLTELSRALDLHTSTLYHLVKTMISLGYLRPASDPKRYRVGRGIFQLASTCYDEIELSNTAAPFLRQLADKTGESSHLAVWEKNKVLVLSRASGSNALQMNERPGTLRPVYCTAIGKALLSGLSADEYDACTRDIDFEKLTPTTLTNHAALKDQVSQVAEDGVAFDDCEYHGEVRCMAAPVRDFYGVVVGAIGFSGPVWRMSINDMTAYIPLVKAIATDLSASLGYTGEAEEAEPLIKKVAGK